MNLIQLVYNSSAAHLMDKVELLEILEVSRPKNARLQITGLLLYKDGTFMQALEGPEEAVNSLYSTIARDPRHKGVQILLQEPIENRIFADWTMGLAYLDDMKPEDYPGLSDFLQKPLDSETYLESRDEVITLFNAFRKYT